MLTKKEIGEAYGAMSAKQADLMEERWLKSPEYKAQQAAEKKRAAAAKKRAAKKPAAKKITTKK